MENNKCRVKQRNKNGNGNLTDWWIIHITGDRLRHGNLFLFPCYDEQFFLFRYARRRVKVLVRKN